MRFVSLILFAILAGALPAAAEVNTSEPPDVEARSEELLETELPTTQHGYELDISLRPKASDVVKEDYIRMPIRVKYGITNNLEFSVTPQTYFANFFKGYFGLYMTDVALGTKYNYGETYPRSGIDMALSFKHIIPVRYDIRISDGYYHYIPAVLLSKRFGELYFMGLGLGVDLVQGEGPPDSIQPNDTMFTSVSFSRHKDNTTYALETLFVTDEVYGGVTESLLITPQASLDVKNWLFDVPGIWTVSTGLRIGLLDAPKDFELLVRLNLHIRFDYKFDVMQMKLIKNT